MPGVVVSSLCVVVSRLQVLFKNIEGFHCTVLVFLMEALVQ